MRNLTDHIVSGDQSVQLDITVTDQPGQGGANHRYEVTGFDTNRNPSALSDAGYKSSFARLIVLFQNGPVKESGVNGITHEALLAIVIDRLRRSSERLTLRHFSGFKASAPSRIRSGKARMKIHARGGRVAAALRSADGLPRLSGKAAVALEQPVRPDVPIRTVPALVKHAPPNTPPIPRLCPICETPCESGRAAMRHCATHPLWNDFWGVGLA